MQEAIPALRLPLTERFFAILLLVFALEPAAFLWSSTGTEGASFLDIPVGAGPAALGSAYSASAKDAYAPVYNPAGLGFLQHPQLAAQHLSYLESIRYEFGSFVIPLGAVTPAEAGAQSNGLGSGFRRNDGATKGALGVSVQYLGSGDIAGTGTSGEAIGDFSVHYAAYSVSYGQKVTEKLALGATGKLIDAKIADTSAKAYAADAGAMYQAGEKLTLSATANNLGSKLTFTSQRDSLPAAYHLSAAFRPQNWLKSSVEGVYSMTGLASLRTGLEWTPLEMIALRAGYKTETTKGLSPLAGLTVGVGVHVLGQEFAYAWLPYGDLGAAQYFSLLLRFGAEEEKRHNLSQSQANREHCDDLTLDLSQDETEFQQLMQLLTEEPDRTALAPAVGTAP